MSNNLGKKFEAQFKQDWIKSFPNTFLYRLPDQQSGYGGGASQNICDFIAYNLKKLFLIECKSCDGGTINFSLLRQYDRLLSYIDCQEVIPIFIIWFKDKDRVIAAPIDIVKQIKDDGNKSISLKMVDQKLYNLIEIPSEKKRVFLSSDYTILGDI